MEFSGSQGQHISILTWFHSCVLSSSYVSLCDNEKTGCKARELKSVYVDAVGQFLKLIFHQNHVNKYNVYNQVRRVGLHLSGVSIKAPGLFLQGGVCGTVLGSLELFLQFRATSHVWPCTLRA